MACERSNRFAVAPVLPVMFRTARRQWDKADKSSVSQLRPKGLLSGQSENVLLGLSLTDFGPDETLRRAYNCCMLAFSDRAEGVPCSRKSLIIPVTL
jgi:hypothetical protein